MRNDACAHTLEGGVDADSVGHLLDRIDRRLAALSEDVGGSERARHLLAPRVAAQRDDPVRTKALRGNDSAQPDGAVSDDGDHAP